MKKALQIIGGSILLLVALSLPVKVAIITLILPEEYESRTRIIPPAGAIVPREIVIIQSQWTLFPVITNLDLQKRFGRQYKVDELPVDVCYKLLQSQLKIRHDTHAELIEIVARSKYKEEAASIANEIAKVYCRSTATTNGGATAVAKIIDAAEPALRPVYPTRC